MTTADQPAPYGSGPATASAGAPAHTPAKVRVHHLQQMKERGEKWAMLTAYEQYAAEIFDEAGIPVLLVGDSAANNVYGYDTSLPVTVDEMLVLVRAVTRSVRRALVVADLPFGSYQQSIEQAIATSTRFMKEGRAHAVKLEGGHRVVETVRRLVDAGIPVMAHVGFTPQSEHALGGYRVQGRGKGADELLADAVALQDAGAFALVMEMVPAPLAADVTKALTIPTIGIGAGIDCDAQVLVWQDMAGLRGGKAPRFVKKYADLRGTLSDAARRYADDVASGAFPAPEHGFEKLMITVELARRLAEAGLVWQPASGDRFVIADREMDSQVFVVSEMVVEAEVLSSGGVLRFNGTTEWALDSVDLEGTLWLPREDQLRTALGDAFVRLERTDLGWAVTTAGPDGPRVSEHADPEDAYAGALLGLLAA